MRQFGRARQKNRCLSCATGCRHCHTVKHLETLTPILPCRGPRTASSDWIALLMKRLRKQPDQTPWPSYGGTDEIIAERTLGLPRGPAPDRHR